MPTYKITGINIGSSTLGESDKILTIFSAERGLLKAVAKGVRKPGAKIAGKAELLNVNSMLIYEGKSLDIISQAESIETFPKLRHDLKRLSIGLYFAELTKHFGMGLTEESQAYLDFLRSSLRSLMSERESIRQCLRFELGILTLLGLRPELTFCVNCREPLNDYKLGAFDHELGGIICRACLEKGQDGTVCEFNQAVEYPLGTRKFYQAKQITPLVWKQLLLASQPDQPNKEPGVKSWSDQPLIAAQRLLKAYIEHRSGRHMRSLDLLSL